MKTKEQLEYIAQQLLKAFARPDMPPFDWRAVEEEVLKVIRRKYEAEVINRVESLDLRELTRFLQVCGEMERAGVVPQIQAPTPAPVETKRDKEAIEALSEPKGKKPEPPKAKAKK